MDGIAIAYRDWAAGVRSFPVAGMVKAGDAPGQGIPEATCLEVMTGAACPQACDTIIPYEDILLTDGVAEVKPDLTVRPAQNVHPRGMDNRPGQVLVKEGCPLNAVDIAIAASVGQSRLKVARLPRICIVATGDELVEIQAMPAPWQLRHSNVHGLNALFSGIAEVHLAISGDEMEELNSVLGKALKESDVLLISGGVSAGKFDFVPRVLQALGVAPVIEKVALRPGKPLWVGQSEAGKLVFGLPGNPISCLVCARRFVTPLLGAKLGLVSLPSPPLVRLGEEAAAHAKLTLYRPVNLQSSLGVDCVAIPKRINGSGDFGGLGNTDGFVELDSRAHSYSAGEMVPFYAWKM